jgi:hypothetical protein
VYEGRRVLCKAYANAARRASIACPARRGGALADLLRSPAYCALHCEVSHFAFRDLRLLSDDSIEPSRKARHYKVLRPIRLAPHCAKRAETNVSAVSVAASQGDRGA